MSIAITRISLTAKSCCSILNLLKENIKTKDVYEFVVPKGKYLHAK